MRHMRKSLLWFFPLVVTFLSGCAAGGAIFYEATVVTVDERKIGAIFSDQVIDAEIRDAYFDDESSNLRSISPFIFNHVVFLVGEYDAEQDRDKAIAIASGIKGVKSVETYLLQSVHNPLCTIACPERNLS